ncbi:hypothetical protein K439DRAFT_358590 [Ramaria rubella]|nr:hypothetical protein K439DRAFT_358590 [Ramaria rubella]
MLQCTRTQNELNKWINSKAKTHYSLDTLSRAALISLFRILPTRGSKESRPLKKLSFRPPDIGKQYPLGHHLAALPDKYSNALLRPDGSSPWHAPPPPFTRRLCVRGRFIISQKSPPRVGMNFLKKAIYLDFKRPGPSLHERDQDLQTVQVRQRLILSQWHKIKTDLISEERVISYSSQPYDPTQINTTTLIPSKLGILSFKFTPQPSMLYAFSALCEDTHRIHFDWEYARSEGYPGLVVQVSLQLIILLDVVRAHMPEILSLQAVDYLVVNPLFAGNQISVFRQWIHGLEKDDHSPVTLADLEAQTKPPIFQLEPEEMLGKIEEVPQQSQFRKQGRRARNKHMALFWTATRDGTVGTVALVVFVPRSGKIFWELDTENGYLVPVGDTGRDIGGTLQPNGMDEEAEGEKVVDEDDLALSADLTEEPRNLTEPFRRLDELLAFDPWGRPIGGQLVSSRELSNDDRSQTSHSWLADGLDAVALEKERLQRKKQAYALNQSRNLLEGQLWHEGYDIED